MFRKFILLALGVMTSLTTLASLFSSPALAATNLLTNPGAESGGTGWTPILNGGDGMSYTFDDLVRSGAQSFQTSYGMDSIYQKVDLFSSGYSTSSMSSSPSISFSVWFATRGDQSGRYYVKFALLEQDGTTVVTSTNFGDPGSLLSLGAGTDWTEAAYTFSNYGPGVRYAYIEFGGQDQSVWAGNYGTHFDDASILAAAVPVTTVASGGGNAMSWWGYLPPKGPFSVTLHGGGSVANATDVMLDVSASPDVDRMAFSRREDFYGSGIVPFASSFPWSVCGTPICAPGTYDVYAKFYQSYGQTSPVQHLVINYAPIASEPIPPAATSNIVPATSTASVLPVPAEETISTIFTRNLRQGDRGPDVKQLQQFMNAHGYILTPKGVGSPGQETEVFGPALRRALVRFQETHAEKALVPFGLKKGTGVFGTQTRNLVNALLSTEK